MVCERHGDRIRAAGRLGGGEQSCVDIVDQRPIDLRALRTHHFERVGPDYVAQCVLPTHPFVLRTLHLEDHGNALRPCVDLRDPAQHVARGQDRRELVRPGMQVHPAFGTAALPHRYRRARDARAWRAILVEAPHIDDGATGEVLPFEILIYAKPRIGHYVT